MLTTNFKTKSEIPWVAELGEWSNNNCESMNHVFKNAVDWHVQPLTTLVHKLKKVYQSLCRQSFNNFLFYK